MAVNIGPKIGIDGEAEFRKELNNLSQQMKTLGSEMKAVTSAFADNDKSQEALSAQADVLTRQIQTQEQKLAQLQKGLEASAKKYGENDTKTLKWAQAVNDATADLNKMRSQMEKTNQSMDQAEGGMEELADATEDAGEAAARADGKFGAMTVAVGNLISSGIQAAVSAVGELIGSIVNLDETTEEYRVAQGKLNTAYEAAGMGADAAKTAYTGFYKILGDTDTATEASQLLAKLTKSEQALNKWTAIAAGVYGTFGDALPVEGLIESANETAKVGEVTGSLADALNWAGISEDAFNERLAAAGSEAARNKLIMDTLSGTYDEASEAFYRNNEALVASRNAQAQMDEALAGLGETIASVKTSLTADFLPAVSQVIQAFSGLLSGAEGADLAFSQALGGLVQKVVEQLPAFLSVGTDILSALASGIIQSIPTLVAALPGVVASIVDALGDLLYQVADVGGDLLGQLAAGIERGLPQLMESLPVIITNILDFITDNLPSVLDQGVSMVNAIADGVLEAIPAFVSALPEIITAVVNFIGQNLPVIVQAGISIIGGLVEGIISAIPGIMSALPDIAVAGAQAIQTLLNSILGAVPEVLTSIKEKVIGPVARVLTGGAQDISDTVSNFFGVVIPQKLDELVGWFAGLPGRIAYEIGLITGRFIRWTAEFGETIAREVPKLISSIVEFFTSLPGRVAEEFRKTVQAAVQFGVDLGTWILTEVPGLLGELLAFFQELPGEILDIGTQIVNGLLSGITGAWGRLVNQVTGLFGELVQGIKDGLGIHSPSRVMRDQVGVMLAEGVAVGLKKGMNSVRRTASQVGDAIVDEINAVNAEIERMEQEESERQAAQELAAYEKSVKEKYAQLAKAELKERQDILDEIADLEADWNEKQVQAARTAEKEAAQARLRELETFQQEYQDRLDEINQEYEDNLNDLLDRSTSMAEKLASYGDLFTEAEGKLTLGNLQDDIDQIRAYGEALAELEARGIPDGLMDEITDMDVADALAYAQKLLSMTDEKYTQYMDLWQQKQEEADKVASQFYKDDLEALQKEYVDKIPESLSGLKDEMETLGVASGQSLADGFASMKSEIIRKFIATVSMALSAVKDFSGINSPSTVWRDQVGLQMARGLGVGFEEGMQAVKLQMQRSIPTLGLGDLQSVTSGLVTGLKGISGSSQESGAMQEIVLKVYLDKTEIAEQIFDPLSGVSRRRGQPIGAH